MQERHVPRADRGRTEESEPMEMGIQAALAAWPRVEELARILGKQARLAEAEIEDAVTAVLGKLLRQAGRSTIVHVRAWARTVMRREIWRIRQTGVAHHSMHTEPPSGDSISGPDPGVLRDLLSAHDHRLGVTLTEPERAVFETIRNGLSVAESAEVLGMSPRDVRTRLSRILKKLAGKLAHLVPPPL